jgi:hypothetical protein
MKEQMRPAGRDQQHRRREQRARESRDGQVEFIAGLEAKQKPGQIGAGADASGSSAKCSGEITRRTQACVETTGTQHAGGRTHRDSDYRETIPTRQEFEGLLFALSILRSAFKR